MINARQILVAGIGNELLRDDGVGIHAVRQFADGAPEGVVVAEIGTAILNSLHLLENARRILAIDAVKANGKPGEIYAFSIGDAADPERVTSMHELNLTSAYRMLPGVQLPEIFILGVEPEFVGYGMELSEPVQSALPRLLNLMTAMIDAWLAEDSGNKSFDLEQFMRAFQAESRDSRS